MAIRSTIFICGALALSSGACTTDPAEPPFIACHEGTSPPRIGMECRDEAECGSGEVCGPIGGGGCGSCPEGTYECTTDGTSDCPAGSHCEVNPSSCGCPMPGTRCVGNCADATDCAAGAACEADGSCQPISCADGYECPVNMRCEAGPYRDDHDCGRVPCAADAECDCGYCVNSACQSDLGACQGPSG